MVDAGFPGHGRCASLSGMSAPLILVVRRHVDYGRVRSMMCMPA